MALTLPGGVSLPPFWTLYFAMGGVAVLLAAAWFAVPGGRVRRFVDGVFGLFTMAQIGVLALAVRREGMAPAVALRSAHFPGVPLYALVLAPLGLTLLSLLAISFGARRLIRGWSTPDAVVVDGKALDMPEEARRLYGRREALQADIGFAAAVGALTIFALNLDRESGWAQAAFVLFASWIWVGPVLVKRVYRARLAPYEHKPAGPDLLAHVRAAAGPLGVAVQSAVVDESPHGHSQPSLWLRDGVLTVSRKLLETTTPDERDFLLRRVAEYRADADGRARARAWYLAACTCFVLPILALLSGLAAKSDALVAAGVVGLLVLPLVGLVFWFVVARRLAVGAWTRAGDRALDATRNLDAALSAVRKCGNQTDDPQTVNGVFFDPRPTVKQQVRALEREARRIGLLPPDGPPRKGHGAVEIPMEPW